MTPQIALDLSLDGIAVLSRADGNVWWREGTVRLDAPDMSERLTKLRARAAARVGEDFTSILIIPESQLLFTSLERDDRDPKVTIRSLLRGRTPYAVEDLAFDYVQKGDRLQVAVVALETLLEAEEFAAGFGFRPVAIIGTPAGTTLSGSTAFRSDRHCRRHPGRRETDAGRGGRFRRRARSSAPRRCRTPRRPPSLRWTRRSSRSWMRRPP